MPSFFSMSDFEDDELAADMLSVSMPEEEEEEEELSPEMVSYYEAVEQYNGFDMQQQKAVDMALECSRPSDMDCESLAIIGVAGCGKTTVIKFIQRALTERYASCKLHRFVVLSATTAMAATLLSALNVYKVLGFIFMRDSATDKYQAKPDWRNLNPARLQMKFGSIGCLIIDEVSMLPAMMMDEISLLFQTVRRRPGVPFGGMQVIVVGDFHQLPPIDKFPAGHALAGLKQYAFTSDVWEKLFKERTVHLTHQHRQDGDDGLKGVLNMIREGRVTDIVNMDRLLQRVRSDAPEHAAIVSPRIKQADKHNDDYLDSLTGDEICFTGSLYVHHGDTPATMVTTPVEFGGHCAPKDAAELRETRLVPFKNVLKVGCRVIVVANISTDLYNGAQGVFLGMDVTGVAALVKLDAIEEAQTVFRHSFRSPVPGDDKATLVYENIPLVVGRAITIHKCQGMTLDAIFVEGGCFEEGQFYVACSRVRTMGGLFIADSFQPRDIIVAPMVQAYYAGIGGLNVAKEVY